MPDLNTVMGMVLSIVEMFGGKVIVAAAMTIVLAVGALAYIADKIFTK